MTAAAGSLIARLRQAGATLMCGNPDSPSQTIVVEINIATDSNTAQVAGFFAEDSETGDIFLMHSGKIGGGRLGIGKTPFLVWSKAKLVDVADEDENFQTGIAVGKLDDPDLPERIWRFVRNLHSFKEEAVSGRLKTTEFNRMVEEVLPFGNSPARRRALAAERSNI